MATTKFYQIHVVVSEDNTLIIKTGEMNIANPNFTEKFDAVRFAKKVKMNPTILDEKMCVDTYTFLRNAKYEIIEYVTIRTAETIEII